MSWLMRLIKGKTPSLTGRPCLKERGGRSIEESSWYQPLIYTYLCMQTLENMHTHVYKQHIPIHMKMEAKKIYIQN